MGEGNRGEGIAISFRFLVGIYSVLPLIVVAILFDVLVLRSSVTESLPANPYDWRWITVFFVYPHIIASTFGLLEKSYLEAYRSKLVVSVAVALMLAFGLPLFVETNIEFLVFAVFTVYHVMMQQIGVAALMWGKPTVLFRLWKWALLIESIFLYLQIYDDAGVVLRFFAGQLYIIHGCLLGLLVVLTFALMSGAKSQLGKYYLWANCIMIGFVFACLKLDYLFFAVLGPRIVHDLTAFAFYVSHESSSPGDGGQHFIYRALPQEWSFAIVVPIMAVLIANLILWLDGHWAFFGQILLALSFFHYCIEGFIWKKGTPHRQRLVFQR